MIQYLLDSWNLRTIERECERMGLEPIKDFDFRWQNDEPMTWCIAFTNDEDALFWYLLHGEKWVSA